MTTCYHIFAVPGPDDFVGMATTFASFTGAELTPTTSGLGAPAFDVLLPHRGRFLERSSLPGAADRLAYDGDDYTDFMRWHEPGDHLFFDEPDDEWYEYRDHRFQFTLDVFFEEDTQEMRDFAWSIAEQCAERWPVIVIYNLESLWAVGGPDEPLHSVRDLTDFHGPHVLGSSTIRPKAVDGTLDPKHWR